MIQAIARSFSLWRVAHASTPLSMSEIKRRYHLSCHVDADRLVLDAASRLQMPNAFAIKLRKHIRAKRLEDIQQLGEPASMSLV